MKRKHVGISVKFGKNILFASNYFYCNRMMAMLRTEGLRGASARHVLAMTEPRHYEKAMPPGFAISA